MRRLLVPVLAVGLLALAALSGLRLDAARRDAGIPKSAARVPLGGFEPIMVNLLWLRHEEYARDRRLSEAAAAIRLVTELQPRVTDGWALLAHVLAWKVSESSGDPEEQWRWVDEAIAILRRGLEHNPESPKLLWTLGSIYLLRVAPYADLRAVAAARLGVPPEAMALETARRYCAADPGYEPGEIFRGNAAYALGLALRQEGDREGAVRAWEEALEVFARLAADPEYEAAGEMAETLGKLLEEARSE